MKTVRSLKYLFFSLRPSNWIKNLIIFLPLVFADKFFNLKDNFTVLLAFFIFCAASSSVYLINDLIDLEGDKNHPLKKLRPIASGKIKPQTAWVAAAILMSLALLASFFLVNQLFGMVICAYLVFNLIYSYFLKQMVIVDVMCIAFFFVLRVLGGLAAIQADLSYWMIICVALLALFVGFNKRRCELELLKKASVKHRAVLEKYNAYFLDQMIAVVTASTVVAYTLYTLDKATIMKFHTSNLVLTVPFVYYGIFRYFYLVHRGHRGGDPVRIFLSDRKMIINILLWVAVSVLIITFKI